MPDPSAYTVGWICAVDVEFDAAQLFLDEEHEDLESVSRHDTNAYKLGKIGSHNVVIAALPDGEYGIGSAAVVARNLLHTFENIRVGLMVGIGGGAPRDSHDIRLGDVVVSSPQGGRGGVLQYDFGKLLEGGNLQLTGYLNQPPTTLRSALKTVKTDLKFQRIKLEEDIEAALKGQPFEEEYGRPSPDSDRLYYADSVLEPGKALGPADMVVRRERTATQRPVVHYGLIASSNQVMKDAKKRDELAQKENVLCFEMEAAGLMNHFPCMVIRGICDYCDSHKNDQWQAYAAMAAAAFAKALVKKINPVKLETEQRAMESILVKLQNTEETLAKIQESVTFDRLKNAELAAYDSTRGQDDFSLNPNTRVEVLENIERWATDEKDRNIYWLSGMAGTGKSTICRAIAERFQKRGMLGATFMFKHFDKTANNASLVISTICRQLIRNRAGLLDFVASEMEKVDDICSKVIEKQFQTLIITPVKNHTEDGEWPVDQILIFDALDECVKHGHIRNLVSELARLCEDDQVKCHLKVFITSRPDNPVRAAFNPLRGYYSEFKLQEMSRSTVDRDIRIFLKAQMADIRDKYNNEEASNPEGQLSLDWPSETDVSELAGIAAPLFIFAATACRFMGNFVLGSPNKRLRQLLESAKGHSDIDAAYLPILRQFESSGTPVNASEETHIFDHFRKIVGTVFLVDQPLSVDSIAQLLQLEVQDVRHILKYLQSVLIIPDSKEDPIRVFHASFRDYLLDNGPANFSIDRKQTHRQIALNCLNVLSESLHYNMCNLQPGDHVSSVKDKTVKQYLPPHVRYACLHWVSHLERGGTECGDEVNLYNFLSKSLLPLMEVTFILGDRPGASRMFERLLLLFRKPQQTARESPETIAKAPNANQQASAQQRLTKLLEDSRTFMAKSGSEIASFPLQIYWSALVFYPPGSLIQEIFSGQKPRAIRYILPEHTRTSVRIIRPGHFDRRGIMSAAISPNNRYIALVDQSATVRVWGLDAEELMFTAKGWPLHPLDYPSETVPYAPLAFTSDSKYLIAGFYSKLNVYKPETGPAFRPWPATNYRDAAMTHIAASRNPTMFAVAYSDYTAEIRAIGSFYALWIISAYRMERPLPVHRHRGPPVSFTSFSGESDIFVTTFGRKIRLWSLSTREALGREFETDEDIVCQSTFLTRRATIATGSTAMTELLVVRQRDGKVSALNVLSKEWEWKNRIYGGTFGSIAISTDATKVVCDSPEGNDSFSVWDFNSGKFIQKLDLSSLRHGSTVLTRDQTLPRPVFFSHDGELLVTVTDTFAVVWRTSKLQNATAQLDVVNFVGSQGSKTKRCFIHQRTPEGDQFLVSTHENGAVKVWSQETGSVLHTFSGRGGKLRHHDVVLSPDAKHLFYSESLSPHKGITTYLIRNSQPRPKAKFRSFTHWLFDRTWLLVDKVMGRLLSLRPRHTHRLETSGKQCLTPWLEQASVIFSPDSLLLAFANSRKFGIWTVRGREKFHGGSLSGGPMTITADWATAAYTVRNLVFNRRSQLEWVYRIRVLNIETQEHIDLSDHDIQFRALALSPNSAWAGSTTMGRGNVSIWSISTGAQHPLIGHECSVASIVFSADSAKMVTGDEFMVARVWSTATRECLHVLQVGRSLRQLRVCAGSQTLDTKFGKFYLPQDNDLDEASNPFETGYSESDGYVDLGDPSEESNCNEEAGLDDDSHIEEEGQAEGRETEVEHGLADADGMQGPNEIQGTNAFGEVSKVEDLGDSEQEDGDLSESYSHDDAGSRGQSGFAPNPAYRKDSKNGSKDTENTDEEDFENEGDVEDGEVRSNEDPESNEPEPGQELSSVDEGSLDEGDGEVESSDAEDDAEVGALENQGTNEIQWQGYGVDRTGHWVTWNGRPLILMPRNADASAHLELAGNCIGESPGVAVGDAIVAWIAESGQLYVVGFHPDVEPVEES